MMGRPLNRSRAACLQRKKGCGVLGAGGIRGGTNISVNYAEFKNKRLTRSAQGLRPWAADLNGSANMPPPPQNEPKGCPEGAPRAPNGRPKGAQVAPKGAQGCPTTP